MSDTDTATDTNEAQAPEQATTEAAPNASAEPVGNWYEGVENISDKDRESKSLGDYVKSTNALRTMIDKKGIIPPGENASDDDKAAFREAVEKYLDKDAFKEAAPEVDKYEVKAIMENEALTDDRRNGIFEKFNKAGITNDQANAVMEVFGEQMMLDQEMIAEHNAASRKESEAYFKEEWGPDYNDRIAGADSVAEKHAEYIAKLEKVGMAGDPDTIRFCDAISRANSEDSPENAESRRSSAESQYKDYINSKEYKSMVARDSGYSAGMPEYDAVLAKARNFLAKSM